MGGLSVFHWILVLAVVVLVFGAGRLPGAMTDLAKGIKSFKAGLKDEPAGPALAVAPGKPLQG